MITLPSVLIYKDIEVFPDHEDCNKYYCIRSVPHVGISHQTNLPIFHAEFWSAAKASDETAVSGFTGGSVNFDVNLHVTDEEKEEIKERIASSGIQNSRYNAIIARIKRKHRAMEMANDSSSTGAFKFYLDFKSYLDSEINSVIEPNKDKLYFGSIMYTSGCVEVLEPKQGSLIEWHSGGGKPAMFGDNNSATAIRLTPMGAAVFYNGIMNRNKDIAIRFDMKLKMRMPAMDIRIYAGSVQKSVIDSFVDKVDKKCKGDKIVYKELTELVTDIGFMNVEIENHADLDENVVQSIRESMMSILQKKIESIYESKIQSLTPEVRKENLSQLITQEMQSFTEMNFSENRDFEYNICPQANIYEFFEDVSDEQLKRMVTTIDLSKQVFAFNKIMVNANALWDEEPFVNNIKVECDYPSADAENRKHAFLFDKSNPTGIWNFRKPKNDTGVVKYTTYVYLKGCSEPVVYPEKTAEGGFIQVNVGKIGIIDLSFKPHPDIKSLPSNLSVTGYMVELYYKDAKGKMIMGPVQITSSNLDEELRFKRSLEMILDQPVHYQVTYFFKYIDPITMPEKTCIIDDDGAFNVTDFPFSGRRSIKVELPINPDESVKEISGEIHYGDCLFPFSLSQEDEWEPVKVNICSQSQVPADYTYDVKLKYNEKGMPMISSTQLKGDKDSNSIILPLRRIEVAGIDLLDLGEKYYRAIVQIDTSEGMSRPMEFRFSPKDKELESKYIYLLCPDDRKVTIKWEMTLYDMNGTELEPVTGSTENSFIMLRPPKNK